MGIPSVLRTFCFAFPCLLAAPGTSQADAAPAPTQAAGALRYRCVGPSRGGRATAVAGVTQRPGEFYMGTTGGGVWKTTTFGVRWTNVSDGFFATPSIGAIRVAPSAPDTVYVGTGTDGLRSNIITGRGVYRSTDAGRTWTFLGLREVGQIGAVEVHPTNPDIVYVAAIGQAFQRNEERGVYRTEDGGRSWKKVLFVSDQIGIVDLELNPANPDELYACSWRAERKPWTIISGAEGCGIYRSTDAGATWKQLRNGLPKGVVGKSDLAVSADDPNRIYALIEAAEAPGLYRSDDRGDSFRRVSDRADLLKRPFYYCNVDADPNDADTIYVNALRMARSKDGGKTWRTVSTPHGDNHEVWVAPYNSKVMVQCNDGGANVTIDGGNTWSTQTNQPTAELYQVAVDDRFPYWLYAGQQDNSTIRVPSQPPQGSIAGPQGFWQAIGGCETGPAVPKPGDADIVYANCKGRFGRYNFRTGQEKQFYVGAANMYGHNPSELRYRFQRVAPIIVSPHDPDTVYHGSQFLHRSTNEGQTWETISPDLTANEPDKQVISGGPITRDITGEEFYSTLYEIAESPITRGLIWTGANDGPIHVTRDGGKTWQRAQIAGLPPGGRVQTIEPSPHRAGKAYACILRYQLGDWRPHVYRTTDFGTSWTRIATGIPDDSPIRVVREDPVREGLLFAGTEFGAFVSFDDGARWEGLQLNLPVTPITDMVIKDSDLVLSTMGRSFWILDNIGMLRQLAKGLADGQSLKAPIHLWTPSPAFRLRGGGRGSRGSGIRYLSTGADIDYHLAADVDQLVMEVLDSENQVVRTIRSRRGGRRPRPGDIGDGMRPMPRFIPERLSADAGPHRFRFDLRHGSAASGGSGRASRGRGPLLVPGTYTVRLRAGDASVQAPLVIRIDPRVAADGVTLDDLRAQRDLLIRVQQTTGKTRRLQAQIKARIEKAPEQADALQKLIDQIATASGTYMPAKLLGQLSYLASMLDRADQRPGRDARERAKELEAWLNRLQSEFAALR